MFKLRTLIVTYFFILRHYTSRVNWSYYDSTQRPGGWVVACKSTLPHSLFPSLVMHSHARGLAYPFLFLFCLSAHIHCAKKSTVSRSLVRFCPPSLLKWDYFHIDAHQAILRSDDQIRFRNDPFYSKKLGYPNILIL
jgi:hypothetical protein